MNHPNYEPFLINAAAATPQPIGALVATVTTSTVVAGSGQSIVLASMVNVTLSMNLNLVGGTGTPETVVVKTINQLTKTITADCVFAHGGTTSVYSVRGSYLARFTINQVGSLCTVNLYNGHPSLSPAPGVLFAPIMPTSQQTLFYDTWLRRGLWYTCSTAGGTIGAYTISYLDTQV